jgi:hypothetical protein
MILAAAISRVRLGHRVRDRLLDQDGEAGVEAVDRLCGVLVVRRAHMHHLGAHGVQEPPMRGDVRHAVPLGHGRRAGRIGVTDADQLGAVEVSMA